jgi:hypothetical protein
MFGFMGCMNTGIAQPDIPEKGQKRGCTSNFCGFGKDG